MLDSCDLPPTQKRRLRGHLFARMICLGRHSVTGLLTTLGRQFCDWTADYRMYARGRVDPQCLFDGLRRQMLRDQPQGPVVAAIDDTLTAHTGRSIHGARYRRDPMGPPFRVNLIRANRFLQLSMAWRTDQRRARMIPVDFVHAPTPAKPRKGASPEQWAAYDERQRRCRLGCVAVERIGRLRRKVDDDGASRRPLWIVGDGGYTNSTVLRQLPERTVFVGRIRADAKLYALPEPNPKGRRRIYGAELPRPEAIRRDPAIPWRKVRAATAAGEHVFRIKTLDLVRWRGSGEQNLRLIVIAPLGYRLRKGGKLLYRKPAYLICTDPEAPLSDVLQAYLWRWDIEVNFRDEKSLLGIGEAKVRHPMSVAAVPAVGVAAYGLLMLAGLKIWPDDTRPEAFALPKWRSKESSRLCLSQLIRQLRNELWHEGFRKTDFASKPLPDTKSQKYTPNLKSALYYVVGSG